MKKFVSLAVIAAMICTMAAVGTAAADYMNFNFDSDAGLADIFPVAAGDNPYWTVKDGVFQGENLVWNTDYSEVEDDPDTPEQEQGKFIANPNGAWVTYDAVMRIALAPASGDADKNTNDLGIALDDNGKPIERKLHISYVNDNKRPDTLAVKETKDDGTVVWEDEPAGTGREFIDLVLHLTNQEIMFSAGGAGNYSDDMLEDPIPFTLDATGETYYDIGMSVMENSLRFFINDQLVFETHDPSYKIGTTVASPLFMWNNGNLVKMDYLRVTSAGDLFPEGAGMGGDSTDNGNVATDNGTPTDTADLGTNNGNQNNAPATGEPLIIAAVIAVVSFGAAVVVKKVYSK